MHRTTRASRAASLSCAVLALTIVAFTAEAQVPVFTDVTPTLLRDPGSWGEGAAWGDFDNDGDLDLLVSSESQRLKLYVNAGNGTFSNFIDFGFGNWTGTAWADYDNDGDIDIFAAQATTPKHLYRNDGGVFTDVTAGVLSELSHTHGVAWADVDLDGDVDLFYAVAFPPVQPAGGGNRLFRNDGGSVFVDITPPVMDDPQYGRGCSFADYDNDGDPDLLVTNFGTTRLYRNDGGVFADVTALPISEYGHAGAVAWGDADNDGDFDLVIGKAFSAATKVYRNDGGTFVDVTPAGFFAIADTAVAAAWVDVDLDADLDLFVGAWNGTRLLRNEGGWVFTDVTADPLGADLYPHGVAWADYDNDGDLDVFYASYFGRVDYLLRNDTPTPERHWLQVELEGTQSNRSAIGARVEVVTGSLRQVRAITAGESYNSMNSLRAHFGLAEAGVADSIVIRWPSGIVQYRAGVVSDQIVRIVERDMTLAVGSAGVVVSGLSARPNPFQRAISLAFDLRSSARTRVVINDVQGRRVRALLHRSLEGGPHITTWDGHDDAGRALPPGVYVAAIEAGGTTARLRIVRL